MDSFEDPSELNEMKNIIQSSVDRVFGGVSAIQKHTVNGKILKMVYLSYTFQSFENFQMQLKTVIVHQNLVTLSNLDSPSIRLQKWSMEKIWT